MICRSSTCEVSADETSGALYWNTTKGSRWRHPGLELLFQRPCQHHRKHGVLIWKKILRRAGRIWYTCRHRAGLLPKVRGKAARFGVYVAYYDSSRIYTTHLECFSKYTLASFNYYVMKNCTTSNEAATFDGIVAKYKFPVVFESWPHLDPLSHGESLQRMIDMTEDEIIVLCDVDAFPICRGWDSLILKELETRDAVGVVAYFPIRKTLQYFLHPCFLAFRRDYLVRNGLNVLPGEGNDPAYQITIHMLNAGTFDETHVCGLFPTSREVVIPNSRPDGVCFGRTDLLHGFGTTYSNFVFHYWFARNIKTLSPIYNDDGELVVTSNEMLNVINKINTKFGPG